MSGTVGTNSSRRSGSIGTAASGATISASDPATDTNATLGTQWANSTSGEFYVCTDAATDENVWTNVGDGTGDIVPYSFQGTVSGYTSGGWTSGYSNVIDKFSFSSDGDATDVGNLTVARYSPAGQSSTTHGYSSSGSSTFDQIDKFSFTSDGDATDVGDVTVGRYMAAGQSSTTHGYTSGGNESASVSNVIDKFSFSSDGDASDVGNLSVARKEVAGQSSTTHGYTSGGNDGTYSNVIDKFSVSSDGDATDVGNITVARSRVAGQQY